MSIEEIGIKPTEHSGMNLFGVSVCHNCQGEESWHSVFIDGRKIPNMLVRLHKENVELQLDGRFVYIFPDKPTARLAASLAANAMAIGMGYPCMGATSKDMPFAPEVIGLSKD